MVFPWLLVGPAVTAITKFVANNTPEKNLEGSGTGKAVQWECRFCGNHWVITQPVPGNYKAMGPQPNETNPRATKPWICSTCNSATDSRPKK